MSQVRFVKTLFLLLAGCQKMLDPLFSTTSVALFRKIAMATTTLFPLN
jgi:hypothetical protein